MRKPSSPIRAPYGHGLRAGSTLTPDDFLDLDWVRQALPDC
ncbi:MAG: hypothetical protein R3C61_12765 [Bacteroidia bacterium]